LSRFPRYLFATAIPKDEEIEEEECPTPNVSYSLSDLFGKPEIPPFNLLVWNVFFLPVKILCP
jgi:hypothetical protein